MVAEQTVRAASMSADIAAMVNTWITKIIIKLLSEIIFQADVVSVVSNTVKVQRLGQSTPDPVYYLALHGAAATLVANDRVIGVKAGANYVILGKIIG